MLKRQNDRIRSWYLCRQLCQTHLGQRYSAVQTLELRDLIPVAGKLRVQASAWAVHHELGHSREPNQFYGDDNNKGNELELETF